MKTKFILQGITPAVLMPGFHNLIFSVHYDPAIQGDTALEAACPAGTLQLKVSDSVVGQFMVGQAYYGDLTIATLEPIK